MSTTTQLFALIAASVAGLPAQVQLGPAPRAPVQTEAVPKSAPGARILSSAWIDTQNRAEVRAAYLNELVPLSATPMGFTGNVTAGNAGGTSSGYRAAVLGSINWFRRMAGVPGIAGFDPVNSAKNQQAALMMSANRALNHFPPTSWTHYTAAGAEAAGNSNLCLSSGLGFFQVGCVNGYMLDSGSGNYAVGHRRWLLYPQTQLMGTGDVDGRAEPQNFPLANSIWAWDSNFGGPRPATRENFVAWPPPGFVPVQTSYPRWSFSVAGAGFQSATVSVVRDGVPVSVVTEPLDQGFGENTIVFRPSLSLPSPLGADRVVDVTISGVMVGGAPRQYQYRVVLFDPNVSPPGSPPTVGIMSPATGTGSSDTFTFRFSDPDGTGDLTIVNVLLNDFLDGAGACYLAFSEPDNRMYLVNDAGTGLSSGIVGAASTLSNSQCWLNLANVSATRNGTELTLVTPLNFSPGFAQNQVAYLAVRDSAGNNSGWHVRGVYQAGSLSFFPRVTGLSPASGGGASQTFSMTYQDAASAANLRTMQLLINADLNGNAACYLGYDRLNNHLYLVADASPQILGPIVPGGGAGSMENSQCRITGADVSTAGASLTLDVDIQFKSGFSGTKLLFGAAQDASGGNSGWQAFGTWDAP